MDKHTIFGVHIHNRSEHAVRVQQLLTEYGGNVKTRLGLHDLNEQENSSNGLLLLEMFGDDSKVSELSDKLNDVPGVEVQQMVFDHP